MLRGLLVVVLGVAAGMTATTMTRLDPRYAVTATAGLAGGVLLLCLGSPRRIMQALIVVIAVTMPLGAGTISNFSTTLFPHMQAPDQFVGHMTAVGGIEISVPMIAAAAVLILSLVVARGGGVLTGFTIKPLPASGFAAMFVAGLLSLVNADDWTLAGFDLFREVQLFLLFTVFFANLDRGTARVYLHGIGVLVIAEGVAATLQFFFGASLAGTFLSPTAYQDPGSSELARGGGILTGPLGLAGILETYLPVVVALALAEERRAARLLYLAAALAGFAGVFASLSRGSWIALPVPLLVVVLALAGKRLMSLRAAIAGMVVAIVIGAAALAVGPTMVQRLTGDDGGSAASRIPMALGALDLIEQYPVFGVGLNNYGDALARHDRFGWDRTFEHINVIVHNLYLWTWAETGTVGLCALFWYFASALWQAARGWRLAGDGFERAIAIGVAMGLVATWIHGFFDIGFRLDKSLYMVSAQIGLLAALPFAPTRAPLARAETAAAPVRRHSSVASARRSLPLIDAGAE